MQLEVQGMMLVDMKVPGAGVKASTGPGRLCLIHPGTGRKSNIFSTLLGGILVGLVHSATLGQKYNIFSFLANN